MADSNTKYFTANDSKHSCVQSSVIFLQEGYLEIVPKHLTLCKISKSLFPIFVFEVFLHFSRYMNAYVVFSFSYELIFLIATNKISVFFFIICKRSPNKLSSSR